MRLAPWLPFLAGLGALPACATGDFGHCRHEPSECAKRARRITRQDASGQDRSVDWPTCPTRAVIESDEVRYLRQLDDDLSVAPIVGWTTRFAAWVPRGLRAYRAERDAADAADNKRRSG